jgi:hypothetical protein
MIRFSKSMRFLALALATLLFARCTEDDLNSPIITLEGDNPTFVQLGGTYTEEGATAEDEEDGVIATINVEGDVITTVVGSYELLYSATDEAGNVGSAVRTVNVFAQGSDFAGIYDVVEECSDGNTYEYTVTITAGANPNTIIISNFGNYGASVVVNATLSGDTNSDLSVDASAGGATFDGTGLLTTGTTTAMEFSLNYSADDTVNVLTCDAVFTKQ